MAILEWLGNLFGRRRTLDQVSLDDLRRERISMDMNRQRLQREIAQLESRKQELFLKGKDAPSTRERTELAQQIYDLETSIQAKSKDQEMVHQRIRILVGLIQLKERMHLMRQMKVGSLLSQLSLEEVAEYVADCMVEDRLETEKLAAMLENLEISPEAAPQKPLPPAIRDIVAAMEQAKAAEEAGHPEQIPVVVKKLDEQLAEKTSESEGT
jgi:hypothetical protein